MPEQGRRVRGVAGPEPGVGDERPQAIHDLRVRCALRGRGGKIRRVGVGLCALSH